MNDEKILEIINAAPLVSVDLIIKNEGGDVLLGKRSNRPAQGYWFVPGGRIRKNEKIADAVARISETELGIAVRFYKTRLLGGYNHIYDDNYLGVGGINTHYVVLAYEYTLDKDVKIVKDDQHSDIQWWNIRELLLSKDVHPYTQDYFKISRNKS